MITELKLTEKKNQNDSFQEKSSVGREAPPLHTTNISKTILLR